MMLLLLRLLLFLRFFDAMLLRYADAALRRAAPPSISLFLRFLPLERHELSPPSAAAYAMIIRRYDTDNAALTH